MQGSGNMNAVSCIMYHVSTWFWSNELRGGFEWGSEVHLDGFFQGGRHSALGTGLTGLNGFEWFGRIGIRVRVSACVVQVCAACVLRSSVREK